MTDKKLLVLLGPQGAGNHMFSKLFALHPAVFGWQALTQQYWLRHEHEPFNRVWQDATTWSQIKITQDFAVTSCSIPCVVNRQHRVPDVEKFLIGAKTHGWQPTVAVIGRDANILWHQQRRVRGQITLDQFLEQLDIIMASWPVTFISHELAVLYGTRYLREISARLQFPVAWDDARITDILAVNANGNYIKPADAQPADGLVWG